MVLVFGDPSNFLINSGIGLELLFAVLFVSFCIFIKVDSFFSKLKFGFILNSIIFLIAGPVLSLVSGGLVFLWIYLTNGYAPSYFNLGLNAIPLAIAFFIFLKLLNESQSKRKLALYGIYNLILIPTLVFFTFIWLSRFIH